MASSKKRVHDKMEAENVSSASTKKKHCQQFIPQYSEKFPILRPSKEGLSYAYCTCCNTDFSVAHGGLTDCRKHVDGTRHKAAFEASSGTRSIKNMFVKTSGEDDFKFKVMNAELLFMNFLVEHNIPMSAADHATALFKQMFPDSKIAEAFRCARTKATALVHHVASNVAAKVAAESKDTFSLSTDGSNDSDDKFFPIVLSHQDSNTGVIKQSLLSVPTVADASATGENIFKTLDADVQRFGLTWDNCVAFGSDNAPVMCGKDKGVYGFIKRQNKHVKFSGCSCHLLHIAAQKGTSCLPVNVEEALVDIYYFLKYSTKRKTELKEIQKLCGEKNLKVLKHVPTRWLSMGKCVNRLLTLRVPLRQYFGQNRSSGDKKKSRADRAYEFLSSYTAISYCMFLVFVMEQMDKCNVTLQADKPLVHKTQRILRDLCQSLLLKFVKPAVVKRGIKRIEDLKDCDLKNNEELVIGEQARQFIKEKQMKADKVNSVCDNIRSFYKAVVGYMLKNLPLEDDVLEHAAVVDLQVLPSKTFSSIRFFLDRFPVMKPSCSIDVLEEQFSSLQLEELDTALLDIDRADKQWGKIREIKDAMGHPKYPDLSALALKVLLIPHSNVSCERVFSNVRKIRTDFRGSMGKHSLEAICTVKVQLQSCNTVCHQIVYTKEDTEKAKKATVSYIS